MLKTIILCGGKGIRLRPLTESVPKSLVALNGKPCLQHIVELYIRKGYRHFVICVGYLGDMIFEFFRKHSFDIQIEFSDAGEDASILERLYHAMPLMGERAFVAYGDTLIDVNLSEMLAEHVASKASITLTTAGVRSPFGLVTADEGKRILSFEEKPVQPYYVGHMLIERDVLKEVDPELLKMPDGEGLVMLFQRMIAKKRIRTYQYTGPQITFNTQRDLGQAERDLLTFFTHAGSEAT